MSKTINYGLNGIFRTALPLTGIALSAGTVKLVFELIYMKDLKTDNPEPTAQEIYDEMGLIIKFFAKKECGADLNKLNAEVVTDSLQQCLMNEYKAAIDMPTNVLLAPAVIVGFAFGKMLPSGLAYLQIAFREATGSSKKVLQEKDFLYLRDAKPHESIEITDPSPK